MSKIKLLRFKALFYGANVVVHWSGFRCRCHKYASRIITGWLKKTLVGNGLACLELCNVFLHSLYICTSDSLVLQLVVSLLDPAYSTIGVDVEERKTRITCLNLTHHIFTTFIIFQPLNIFSIVHYSGADPVVTSLLMYTINWYWVRTRY